MPKKVKLKDLKVKSFVTQLDPGQKKKLKAGATGCCDTLPQVTCWTVETCNTCDCTPTCGCTDTCNCTNTCNTCYSCDCQSLPQIICDSDAHC